MTTHSVPITLSTKCWEGDYRGVLTPEGIDELFGPLGGVSHRQVVLNRIDDRAEAEQLARRLIEAGTIQSWLWAEDRWPEIARQLGLPDGWFGPAWPYSVPELCELHAAPTKLMLHMAGDVRFPAPEGWLSRALNALNGRAATVATATPPAGADWVRARGQDVGDGWIETQLFSDQLFLIHPAELLRRTVMRAEHPAAARYPKPGGALTFEARVGAWLASEGLLTLVDLEAHYLHPVAGREGDSYHHSPMRVEAAPAPPRGGHYPTSRASSAVGLVISQGDVGTIGASVTSLGWCASVTVVDVLGSKEAEAAARSAGAEVRPRQGTAPPEVVRRQLLLDMTGWVVDLQAGQLCTGALAQRLHTLIEEDRWTGLEARCRSWFGGSPLRGPDWGAPRRLVAYRADGLTFGPPLDGYRPLPPAGSIQQIPSRGGAVLLQLEAPDLAVLLERINTRSSWRAYSLVLKRGPGFRMPLSRLVRSYLTGHWRYGRRGPQRAMLDAFEDWLMIQKWREGIRGGRVAAMAEFEEVIRNELRGDEREPD